MGEKVMQQVLPTFDNITPECAKPKRLSDMYWFYGRSPDRQCKNCMHLFARARNRTYYKCDLTAATFGPATDWRVNWEACGRWEEREKAT